MDPTLVRSHAMKFRIVIEQDEDGKFAASCPTLPGCWSQGDTREEARRNIADAMTGYLESLNKHGDPIPPAISEDVIDIEIGKVA
jgi:predicted RNase H-like HicB family nuclease